jgi:hypothetical protein
VRRKTLCLVRTKTSVCDEDGPVTDGCVRDEMRIDPHSDVQADVLGVG